MSLRLAEFTLTPATVAETSSVKSELGMPAGSSNLFWIVLPSASWIVRGRPRKSKFPYVVPFAAKDA